MLPFEWLLPLGALGFYVFDAMLLLYSNELVFRKVGARWTWSTGLPWTLMGKQPYLPNPVAVMWPCFRLSWSPKIQGKPSATMIPSVFFEALFGVQVLVSCLAVLLFLGLPLVLIHWGTGALLLGLFVFGYGVLAQILIYAYARRAALGLSRRAWLGLAVETTLCLPFALNLVQKICLRQTLAQDPVSFARQHLSADDFAHFLQVLCQRVEDELTALDESSASYQALDQFRMQLKRMTP